MLQKEIEVLFNEIFLPILEMRHATLRQKSLLLGVYQRLCQDPQALVEIYINYDCDRTALENIYERLVNIIARIGQTHFAPPSKAEEAAAAQNLKQTTAAHGPTIPGTLAASSLAESAASQAKYAHLSPEQKLKRQSLECLVAVLKSLVVWGTAGSRPAHDEHGRSSEDVSRLDVTNGELMEPRMSISGAQTPDVGGGDDEVEKFESAKQKKTSLLEGIKKFNFKPKRVSHWTRPEIDCLLQSAPNFVSYRRAFNSCWSMASSKAPDRKMSPDFCSARMGSARR
jgi:brefeldin A-inhibited guanine nucleotide-exchange protein